MIGRRTAVPLATLLLTWLTALAGPSALAAAADAGQPALALNEGDHVAFVGNTFAERMVQFGYFEALLQSRFPNHKLLIRNLGWSADTPSLQPRPLNFGDVHTHLANQKADVIFLCFGMNESFEGPEGLPRFEQELNAFIDGLLEHKYNGRSPPRLVLVGPIPHEKLGGELPDPAEHNKSLKLYSDAMAKLAAARKIPFVDLYGPLLPLMKEAESGGGPRLTLNGIHLTRYGYWVAAQLMADQLGLSPKPVKIELIATKDGDGATFHATDVTVPPAPPPLVSGGAAPQKPHAELLRRQPLLVAKGLKAGRYTLAVDGKPVLTADAAEWADGVPLVAGPAAEAAAKLQQAIAEKNRQFFMRWRAVNGEYIYGRRKEPFGVANFPGEMAQLDKIVAEDDQKIWQLNKLPGSMDYDLKPAK